MHKGDALNYIYYVVTGSMEILKGGMVVAILGKVLQKAGRFNSLIGSGCASKILGNGAKKQNKQKTKQNIKNIYFLLQQSGSVMLCDNN